MSQSVLNFPSLYSRGQYPSVLARASVAVTMVLFAFFGGNWIKKSKSDK